MYGDLEKAYKFAKEKHKGQLRKFSKKPYLTHLVRTYKIVKYYTEDRTMLVAALLHDIVEDTSVTVLEIKILFGEEVAEIVDQLTYKGNGDKKSGLKKEVGCMSSKSKIVKLSDRTANVIGLFNPLTPVNFINRYVEETEYVFGGVVIDNDSFKSIQLMLWKKLFSIIKILKIKLRSYP